MEREITRKEFNKIQKEIVMKQRKFKKLYGEDIDKL